MEAEALPVFDRDHLDRMTGGDLDLSAEILDLFREQAAIWSRLLDPANPTKVWADAAHTLKGAALSAGALQLARACSRAETLGRREQAPPSRTEAAVALSQVKDDLADALEAVAAAAHDIASSGARKASNDANS